LPLWRPFTVSDDQSTFIVTHPIIGPPGATGDADYDWARRLLSPHPLRTFMTPLSLRTSVGNGLPRT
jgi:hypothetical protein